MLDIAKISFPGICWFFKYYQFHYILFLSACVKSVLIHKKTVIRTMSVDRFY